jgi:hypothetical protein
MKCPECQFQNESDARFCNECGHQSEIACPECENTNLIDLNLFHNLRVLFQFEHPFRGNSFCVIDVG